MMPTAISYHFADVNGFTMHYASAGKPENPLVMLLHGFPDMCYIWRPHMLKLAEHYYLVAPDQRGINKSDVPIVTSPFHIDNLVADVKALANYLGYSRYFLVGHDWGGVVAWRLANNFPEALIYLVIINSPHPVLLQQEILHNKDQRLASRYIERIRSIKGDAYTVFAPLLDRHLSHPFFDDDTRVMYREAYRQSDTLDSFVQWYREAPFVITDNPSAIPAHLLTWGKIDCKTHVIWGEADQLLLPPLHEKLGSLSPNLSKEVHSKLGHNIHLDQPQILVDALNRFSSEGGLPLPSY